MEKEQEFVYGLVIKEMGTAPAAQLWLRTFLTNVNLKNLRFKSEPTTDTAVAILSGTETPADLDMIRTVVTHMFEAGVAAGRQTDDIMANDLIRGSHAGMISNPEFKRIFDAVVKVSGVSVPTTTDQASPDHVIYGMTMLMKVITFNFEDGVAQSAALKPAEGDDTTVVVSAEMREANGKNELAIGQVVFQVPDEIPFAVATLLMTKLNKGS